MNIVQVVREDLAFLQVTFDEGAPPSRIRQESGTLRRLLLDGGGALQKARRVAGHRGEATVEAHRLSEVIDGLPDFTSGVVTAGPCRYNGRTLGSWAGINAEIPEGWGRNRLSSMVLSEYLREPGLKIDGRTVSRKNLLRYVANKLGGVHLDSSRSRKGDEVFTFLDRSSSANGEVSFDGYSAIYLEIASIGQALVRSTSVMTPFGLVPSPLVPPKR